MDFGNSSVTGETPFRPNNNKKALLEAARQEVRSRVSRALMKLHDRDTIQSGYAEIVAVAEELKPEHASVVVNQLCEFEDPKNVSARCHAARLLPAVASANYSAVQNHIGKMVQSLCKRIKDSDMSVRDAVAEAIGEMARIVCLQDTGKKQQQPVKSVDDTQGELDLSELSMADDGAMMGYFFKPILQGIEGADQHFQQGCSTALAHVIFNAGSKMEPHIEKIARRVVGVLDRQQFSGKAQLLTAVANMVEVCPDTVVGLLKMFLPRIYAAANSAEWNTRKAAMETLETICTRLPEVIFVHKADMLGVAEKNKYDKMKPVREAACLALAAIAKVSANPQCASADASAICESVLDETTGADEVDMEESSRAELEQQAAMTMSQSAAQQQEPATPRQPVHNSKAAATVSKSHAVPPDSTIKRTLSSSSANNMASSMAGNGGYVPSKEQWDALLRHFDVITRQQDQLIEMVTGFSESARERLETVEQKVFAIELRLAQQDNRQSLPGMPPTPSRAIITPSKTVGATPSKILGTPARVPLAPFQEVRCVGHVVVRFECLYSGPRILSHGLRLTYKQCNVEFMFMHSQTIHSFRMVLLAPVHACMPGLRRTRVQDRSTTSPLFCSTPYLVLTCMYEYILFAIRMVLAVHARSSFANSFPSLFVCSHRTSPSALFRD